MSTILSTFSTASISSDLATQYPAQFQAHHAAQCSAIILSHKPVFPAHLAALQTAHEPAFQPTHGTAHAPAFFPTHDSAVSSGLQRVSECGGVLLPVLKCGSHVVRGSAGMSCGSLGLAGDGEQRG